MNKSYRAMVGATLLAAMLVVTGCGGGAKTTVPAAGDKTSPQATTAPAKKDLVIDLPNQPATLDPGMQYDTDSYSVYRNIFDTLLARNPESGQIEGRLATAWKVVSDTEWEFTLKSGVKFHNGDAFTAADVKYSVDRILNPATKSPQFGNFSAIKEVKIVNDTTVHIITAQPYPALLAQLVNLGVVNAKYTTEKGTAGLSAAPVGTGPYTMAEWKKGQYVLLKANPDYWRGQPTWETVKFRAVPEPATRVADLQAGTADMVSALDSDLAKTLATNPKLQTVSVATERVAYLAFNPLGKTPTKDKLVRQAIAAAINRKEIIDALLGGKATAVNGLLTPLHVGFDAKVPAIDFNQQKAKDLLKQAGFEKGVELTFLTSPAYDQRIVQALQGQLALVGIKVNIQQVDHPTYLKKIQGPDHDWGDIRFGRWSCSCLDADGVIYPVFRTGSIWSSYSSPAFDALVDEARVTIDVTKRQDLYSRAEAILSQDTPGIGLWQDEPTYALSKTLKFKPTPDEQLQLFDLKPAK